MATPAVTGPAATPGAPMQAAAGGISTSDVTPVIPAEASPDVTMGEAEDDDEAMQLALAMSMSQEAAAAATPAAPPAAGAGDMSAVFQDPNFVSSVLGSLPGVDVNDPRIQSVLNSLPEKKDGEGDDKKEDK